ncbi:hypothetical protein [Georgenia sp. AZ-5]|uniref:hypothetical protein n=1 Tax=Georgenia sp. AZ-5 TaxID=3367526 RepID=UPI00375462E8
MLRSTAGIMSDEGLHDEVTYARTAGVTVISPELDIHDALTVDPGLIAIAMDYGYLRAAEATQPATDEQRLLARDLIELRRQIWALETELLAPGDDDATPDLRELVALKRELRALVSQAPQDWLPPGAHGWWRTFERHPWEVTLSPTWV